MTWTFGSLFAGIGGLDLGLERAGWECRWQVEIDPFCRRVLDNHWPAVPKYEDVKTIEWDAVESVDLICGGFPCQPVSRVGKRRAQADERWLWPEFACAIRYLRPRFVLVENVPGLLAHGMGDVLGDLAGIGYDAEWESVPAAAVGAPHLRDRVFVVAWPQHGRALADTGSGRGQDDELRAGRHEPRSGGTTVADTDSKPLVWSAIPRSERNPWAAEPDVGRLADGLPARLVAERLRVLGNAVVPQVAEWIGRRLMEAA